MPRTWTNGSGVALSADNLNSLEADLAVALSREPALPSGNSTQYLRGDKTMQTLNKTAVGLANVNDTADSAKPVSTAQAAAIGKKLDIASSNLLALSSVERDVSQGSSRIRWDDAAEWTDSWANLTSWQARDVQVSGGKLFRATSPADTNVATGGLAVRALSGVGATGDMRIRSSFVLPAAGSAGGFVLIGAWAGSTAAAPATLGTGGLAYGIGFRQTNVPVGRDGAAGSLSDLGSALPAGTYTATVTADIYGIGVAIEDSTGLVRATTFYPLPSRTAITGVFVMNTDTRHTAGIGIGPANARAAIVTAKVRAGIEGTAPSLHRTETPGTPNQDAQIFLPASYDSRKPVTLVLYSHARGGGSGDPWVGSNPGGPLQLTMALTNAGYAVASNNQHGNNWGNQASVDDLFQTYKRFRDTHNLGAVVVLAQSMGGLAALNAIVQKRIPGIRGFYGVFPAANLAAVYAAGTYASDIRTAFGIAGDGSDYAAKTSGMDPALQAGEAFQGIPMRFRHSAGDTVINKANNSDLIAAKVLPYTTEAAVVATTGDHGDASNFNSTDIVSFFDRCVSAV